MLKTFIFAACVLAASPVFAAHSGGHHGGGGGHHGGGHHGHGHVPHGHITPHVAPHHAVPYVHHVAPRARHHDFRRPCYGERTWRGWHGRGRYHNWGWGVGFGWYYTPWHSDNSPDGSPYFTHLFDWVGTFDDQKVDGNGGALVMDDAWAIIQAQVNKLVSNSEVEDGDKVEIVLHWRGQFYKRILVAKKP